MGGLSSVPRVRTREDERWSSGDRWEVVIPTNTDSINDLLDSEFNWQRAREPLAFAMGAIHAGHVVFSRNIDRIRQSRAIYNHPWMVGNVNERGAKQGTWLYMSTDNFVLRALVYDDGLPIVVYSYAVCEPRRLMEVYEAATDQTNFYHYHDDGKDNTDDFRKTIDTHRGDRHDTQYSPIPVPPPRQIYGPPPVLIDPYGPLPVPLVNDYEHVDDILGKEYVFSPSAAAMFRHR